MRIVLLLIIIKNCLHSSNFSENLFPGDCDFENPLNPLCSWEIVPGDLMFVRVEGRQNTTEHEGEDHDKDSGRQEEGRQSGQSRGRRSNRRWKSRTHGMGESRNESMLLILISANSQERIIIKEFGSASIMFLF